MAKLDEIAAGSKVTGILGSEPVTVVATKWHGDSVLTVTYKTEAGTLGETMVYRFNEHQIEVENSRPWSFDADADDVRLVSEAYRISLAHLFDPYLAVRTSAIEPLPHQVSAVYQDMLPRMPLRYVLADDPGAGKTIMTGLLLKEMISRGDLKRCLIVCPGNLAEQWQDELYRKFNLKFNIMTNDCFESAVTGNAFTENDFSIARLDKLARNEDIQVKLGNSMWDLIVCDEAHKMSATYFGNEAKYTKRFLLGRLLGEITENLLLLTATPHNGKPEDFQLFMSLVDRDRFEGAKRNSNQPIDVSDVVRRLVKEELLKFDGRPLFPERIAYTVNYTLSNAEAGLYDAVTDYVTEEFNRADRLDGKRKNSVGFALTILQRRLASSPEAIYQSLKRRRERLEARLQEALLASRGLDIASQGQDYAIDDDFDEDDYSNDEFEGLEEDVLDAATAAATIPELEAEIDTLKKLERKANDVRQSGEDRKWDELSKLLQDDTSMFDSAGRHEKLIIFTEHKDTLNYLATKIRSLLGNEEAVLTIKGGMLRDERRKAEERFRQEKDVRILVATDAAGEGINLQRAHLMVNYDLPWNPNRLEQRFGRIHRIGQTEVCHLWNLVANETREGEVFQRLFSKLNEERSALGGKVFDILGRLTFNDKPLRELLLEAVRYGNDPEVKARLNQVVDNSLDTAAIKEILDQYALTADMMDVHSVMTIREDMERIEARKLEPHFIEAFFLESFKRLGGRIVQREDGRYEVLETPFSVREKDMQVGSADPILKSYERICFSKEKIADQGMVLAEFVYPGHPLLDAVVSVLMEQKLGLLKKGTVFIDDQDYGETPRLLFYAESTIQDGTILPDDTKRVISKNVHFVEINEQGEASSAGYAPYLDYRKPSDSEKEQVEEILRNQTWLGSDTENIAMDYAIQSIIPNQIERVSERRLTQTKKVEKAVEARLTAEIQYWDYRASELKQKESLGKGNTRLNSHNAEKRADELAERLSRRKAQLAREKLISPMPPRIVGGALVIPAGMLRPNQGSSAQEFNRGDKKAIEIAGMRAVMSIERQLGFTPKDVSADKCGYDIESHVPESMQGENPCLRLIEVKGRTSGSATVTVSKNEILCALNKRDSFYLAIVEVEGNITRTTYLKDPFTSPPDFSAVSTNYNIDSLKANAEIVFEKEETWQ